jgi:hypothetical protein
MESYETGGGNGLQRVELQFRFNFAGDARAKKAGRACEGAKHHCFVEFASLIMLANVPSQPKPPQIRHKRTMANAPIQ